MDPLLLALARAQDDADRLRFLEAHPELRTSAGVRSLLDLVSRRPSDPEVPEVISAALALARTLDPQDRGEALLAVGRLLFRRGRYAEAERLGAEAATCAEATGRPGIAFEAHLLAIDCSGARGDSTLGLARAAEVEATLAGRDLELARLWAARGHLHLSDSRYAAAIEDYGAAARTLAALGETRLLAEVDLRRAVAYQRLARLDEAEELLRRVLDAFLERERAGAPGGTDTDSSLVAMAASNLGVVSYTRGRFGEALARYEEARSRFEKAGSRAQEAMVLDNIAETYLELNLLAEGEELAERAAAAFAELGLDGHRARADMNLARAWLRGRPERRPDALERLARARDTFLARGDRVWAMLAGLDLARALVEEQPDEAARLATVAEHYFAEMGMEQHALLARWTALEARSYHSKEPVDGACLRDLRDRANELHLSDLCMRVGTVIGALAEDEDEPLVAREEYERAMRIVESTRAALGPEEFRAAFLADKTDLFERYVTLEIDWATIESADEDYANDLLFVLERVRGRILLDSLQAREAGRAPGTRAPVAVSPAAAALETRLQEVREQIRELQRRRHPTEADPTRPGLERSPVAPLQHEERLEEEFASINRRLQSLRPDNGRTSLPRDLADRLEARLDADTGFIEYYEIGDALVSLTLYRGACYLYQHDGKATRVAALLAELEDELTGTLVGVDAAEVGASHVAALARRVDGLLRELHDVLLGEIDIVSRAFRLIIAPYGPIHFAPFAALVSPRGPLIERCQVSIVPSAASLIVPRRRNPSGRPVILSGESGGLAGAGEESAGIARLLDRPILLDGDAPDLAARLGDAPLVHFAGHARLRRDNPLFSRLDTGGAPLTLADILELDMAADLVTLAGCETASGAGRPGDELLGFARGFLHAGAQAVVAALWPVDDEATRFLMERFYRHLAKSPPAAALRAAQLEVRALRPHPYYWAGFVHVGAPDVGRTAAGEGV